MAITLAQLKKHLDEIGLKYTEIERDRQDLAVLSLSWQIDDISETGKFDVDMLAVLQEPAEDKSGFEFLNLRSRKLDGDAKFHEADEIKKAALFSYLLDRNNTIKIGRWCFDKSDGEVVLDHPIAIEKGDLAKDQLKRSVMSLVSEGKKGYVALRRIKAHNDPEKALEDNSKIASTILTQLAMQDPQLLTTFVLNKEKFDKHPDALVSIRDLLVGKDMQAAAALIQTIADN